MNSDEGIEFNKGCKEMRTQQTGIGGLQLLLAAAAIAAVSLVTAPGNQALDTEMYAVEKVKVAEALNFASESKHKIAQSFLVSDSLPRTAKDAYAMKPTMTPKPEFVRDVKFQHDYAGETIMIMVHLNAGVVENILGGEQYVYIAGIKAREGNDALEWQCGARNVDLALLPEECRS